MSQPAEVGTGGKVHLLEKKWGNITFDENVRLMKLCKEGPLAPPSNKDLTANFIQATRNTHVKGTTCTYIVAIQLLCVASVTIASTHGINLSK